MTPEPTSSLSPLSRRSYGWLVAALLLLTLARGLVWTVATPPWQAPDEPSHASYAEHLREHPSPFAGRVFFSVGLRESLTQAQLEDISHVGEYSGVLAQGELAARRHAIESISDKDAGTRSWFEAAAGGYPPTYYLLGGTAMRLVDAAGGSYLAQIQSLRILSVLLTTIALALQIGVLQELLGRGMRAIAGGAIIALMPMYAHIFSSFNPDVLMAVWFSGALWASLVITRRGASIGPVAGLVGCVAFGLVTKPTAFAMVPLALLVAVIVLVRNRGERSRRRRAVLAAVAAVAAVTPLVIFTRLDDPIGTASELASTGTRSLSIDAIRSYANAFMDMFMKLYHTSFWGSFGWLDTPFRPELYRSFLFLAIVAFAGLIVRVVVRRRIPLRWVVALTPALALGALLVAIEFTTFSSGSGMFIQGRYLYPVIVVLVAAYVSGITALDRYAWFGRAMVAGSVLMLLTYQLMALAGLVLPRYTL